VFIATFASAITAGGVFITSRTIGASSSRESAEVPSGNY
jgi:hypothetical protein